jgi:signal peptidase I
MKRRIVVLPLLVALLAAGCSGSGDRVLVGKFLYDSGIDPPHRYDVVVFKYPRTPIENGTPKNYIKRLIGLPGELIAIFFGRLFCFFPGGPGVPDGISKDDWDRLTDTTGVDKLELWDRGPTDHPTAEKLWKAGKFKMLRKPPPVMLALSRPVYDNDHQAADLKDVLPPRWAARDGAAWKVAQSGFELNATGNAEDWVHYRHILRPVDWPAQNVDTRLATISSIKQRTHMPELITDFMGYNTYRAAGHGEPPPNWVGDLLLECTLTVQEPKGEFWMELSKGPDRFQARIDLATGSCSLYRWSEHKTKEIVDGGAKKSVPDWQLLGTAQTKVKGKGVYPLRFANYDERLTLWVGRDMPFEDGHEYPAPAYYGPDKAPGPGPDWKLDTIQNNDLQPASLCGVGANVVVNQMRLWRDTYYTDHKAENFRGGIGGDDWKNPDRWEPLRELRLRTFYVYPEHYFCLGDNSPESSDSRYWGLVPSRLMLGRALMVYFPFDRAGLIK